MFPVQIATVQVTPIQPLTVIPAIRRISMKLMSPIIKQIILAIIVLIVMMSITGHQQHLITTRQVFN